MAAVSMRYIQNGLDYPFIHIIDSVSKLMGEKVVHCNLGSLFQELNLQICFPKMCYS